MATFFKFFLFVCSIAYPSHFGGCSQSNHSLCQLNHTHTRVCWVLRTHSSKWNIYEWKEIYKMIWLNLTSNIFEGHLVACQLFGRCMLFGCCCCCGCSAVESHFRNATLNHFRQSSACHSNDSNSMKSRSDGVFSENTLFKHRHPNSVVFHPE